MTEIDFLEEGRLLFAGPCDFFFASASSKDLPYPGAPEIAFAGRSNVGKSSLLNALTNRKSLALDKKYPSNSIWVIFKIFQYFIVSTFLSLVRIVNNSLHLAMLDTMSSTTSNVMNLCFVLILMSNPK